MLRLAWTLCISLLLFFNSAHAQIDLHAHLDMKPGLGFLLQGDWLSPPQATYWKSHFHSRASEKSLELLHTPPLIVVSLYAHPYLSVKGMREALDQEYEHLVAFVAENDKRFGIAKNADEAEKLIAENKTALIFSIEGAYGVLETDEDFKKWIDDRGVAMVTPFHLTEDQFGGIALMSNFFALLMTPLDFIKSLYASHGMCLLSFCKSTVGIKRDGYGLIDRLISHHVWIDVSHANEITIQELVPIFDKNNLPLMVSHTQIREVYPAERGLGQPEIDYIKKQDGIIGLLPTDDMLKIFPEQSVDAPCKSGLANFKYAVKIAINTLGQERVALGSDTNSPIVGLSPECASEPGRILTAFEKEGFYTYSQWGELNDYVSPNLEWQKQTLSHFLKLWRRVRP